MKQIISFILRNVPRTLQQRVSHFILPVVGLFLRGNKHECPIAGKTYRRFLPYGRIEPRPNVLCPDSLSLERHRLIWLFLKERTRFFDEPMRVLHIAPELCFMKKFEDVHGKGYITADLESPLAKVKMDVHDIPFESDSFDCAFCNHVMEHVDDDIKAMSEICRVLKPGGWAIIQSPVYHDMEKTFEDPSITDPLEREKVFKQKDHQRIYGRDYGKRLQQAGFKVSEERYVEGLSPEKVERYRIGNREEQVVYFCSKPV